MAVFGSVGQFIETKENWSQYVETLEQFFIANDIAIKMGHCLDVHPSHRLDYCLSHRSVTDHKPLLTLLNESWGIPTTTSNRI